MIVKLLIILIGSLVLSLWLCKRFGIRYSKAPVIALIPTGALFMGYLFFRSATNLFIVTFPHLVWGFAIVGLILVLLISRLRKPKP